MYDAKWAGGVNNLEKYEIGKPFRAVLLREGGWMHNHTHQHVIDDDCASFAVGTGWAELPLVCEYISLGSRNNGKVTDFRIEMINGARCLTGLVHITCPEARYEMVKRQARAGKTFYTSLLGSLVHIPWWKYPFTKTRRFRKVYYVELSFNDKEVMWHGPISNAYNDKLVKLVKQIKAKEKADARSRR